MTVGYFLTNIQEGCQEKYQIRKLENFSDEDIPAINGILSDICTIETMETIIRDVNKYFAGDHKDDQLNNKTLLKTLSKTRDDVEHLLEETVKYYQVHVFLKTSLI